MLVPDILIMILPPQGNGTLTCRWRNCNREFTAKNYLVDHVTSNHIEHRKGCDDFPCFWEVGHLQIIHLHSSIHVFSYLLLIFKRSIYSKYYLKMILWRKKV